MYLYSHKMTCTVTGDWLLTICIVGTVLRPLIYLDVQWQTLEHNAICTLHAGYDPYAVSENDLLHRVKERKEKKRRRKKTVKFWIHNLNWGMSTGHILCNYCDYIALTLFLLHDWNQDGWGCRTPESGPFRPINALLLSFLKIVHGLPFN